MSKLLLSFETTFAVYEINELIGQGGSGRVYGGVDPDGTPIALKVLSDERASSDKRRRFKNEIGFLARNRHKNIVTLLDHGVARSGKVQGPFYVMKRYSSSLRPLMGKLDANKAIALFSQILDGVEAAHMLGAVHRDLKPENVLYDPQTETIALADFGIASFTEELLTTAVDTAPQQRLANFQYAAPEQRTPGCQISTAADIYALGLMMNEIFTGQVPHGTDFKAIGEAHADIAFLDPIVTQMLKQAPAERPKSIGEIKGLIQRYKAEAVTQQRLSQISQTVIPAGEIDEPLAYTPPTLIGADWDNGQLKLVLDRPVNQDWVRALQNMGNYTSVMGIGPETFRFRGNEATVGARPGDVQQVINYFKEWLPRATSRLMQDLLSAQKRRESELREELRIEKQKEEQRLSVLRNIKI